MTHGRHSVAARQKRRRWLIALAILPVVVAVPAVAATSMARSTAARIVFSLAADRSHAAPLSGAKVSGRVYVFLGGKDVTRVTYYLDRSRTSGTAYSRSTAAPFDLVAPGPGGSTRPLDVSQLTAGSHTLVASIVRGDGSNRVMTSRFTVTGDDSGALGAAAAAGSARSEGSGGATPGSANSGAAASGSPATGSAAPGAAAPNRQAPAEASDATQPGSPAAPTSLHPSAGSAPSGAPDSPKAAPSTTATGTGGSAPAPPASTGSSGVAGLRVSGNHFVEADGSTVRLVGFNFSGAEYSCIEGSGIFDTPETTSVTAAEVQAMRSWSGANVVRVNLNEQCWLGIGGASSAAGGQAYQAAIHALVGDLNKAGFYVVLDLHRSAPGSAASKEQEPMPDRDHSPTFWSQVAAAYKSNLAVAFDLFNEPFPYGGADSTAAWQCWRDGGCTQTSANGGGSYVVAGMNELISAVRGAGAQNVVLAGGLNYAEVTSHWLQYKPTDPSGNLAVSVHVYSFNDCASASCYNGDMASVAAKVPMFVGEFGPDLTIKSGFDQNCPQSAIGSSGFSSALVDWMDAHGVSYAAWAFDTWGDCWALVKDWAGTPTPVWGAQIKARIAKSAAMS